MIKPMQSLLIPDLCLRKNLIISPNHPIRKPTKKEGIQSILKKLRNIKGLLLIDIGFLVMITPSTDNTIPHLKKMMISTSSWQKDPKSRNQVD